MKLYYVLLCIMLYDSAAPISIEHAEYYDLAS